MQLMSSKKALFTMVTLCAASACAPANPQADAAIEAAADASVAPDASSSQDAAMEAAVTFPTLNDCQETDYADLTAPTATRTVMSMGSTSYTPRCLTITQGQTVTFAMDFSVHPLASGIAHGSSAGATTPNPIAAQTTGSTYTATFDSAGFFPFKCTVHQHVGMAGVVRVVPAM